MGHLTRALSLARQAARKGIRSRILCNSPFLPALLGGRCRPLLLLDPLIEFVCVDSQLGREALTATSLREVLRTQAQDVLIVDTFPRGIGGELAEILSSIQASKVFVHRDLSPEYVRQANLQAVLSQFDLIIVPGEDAPLEALAHHRTEPWMICDAGEVLPRHEARCQFGVTQEELMPLILVSGSGSPQEALDSARFARRLKREVGQLATVRFASLDSIAMAEAGEIGCSLWPLLMTLAGVDLLIGAGGYHTVYEARRMQCPLLAIPRRRMYDRQSRRLIPSERVENFDQLLRKVLSQIADWPNLPVRSSINYLNGSAESVELILRKINSQV